MTGKIKGPSNIVVYNIGALESKKLRYGCITRKGAPLSYKLVVQFSFFSFFSFSFDLDKSVLTTNSNERVWH